MNEALFGSIRSEELDRLLEGVKGSKNVALTGLPETMAAFMAAKLSHDTGKRVLLLAGNDLRATHDADDVQQLLGTQAAFLPGGEIDLTRGASSHESAWRRLEALTRIVSGEVSVLTTSVDALMQRMGSAENFGKAIIRLNVGDEYDPKQLMRDLTHMGYERVGMVEGKAQCAMRGAIVDVYPPSGANSLRIEFFGDAVDSIRTFDCLSQRSLELLDDCVLCPATEVLLDEDEWAPGAMRMREAIRAAQPDKLQESALFADLPPLPDMEPEESDGKAIRKPTKKELTATRMAELERRAAQLMNDADVLEGGTPFRRIRAWLPLVTQKRTSLLDWFQPDIVVLCEPELLRKRTEERMQGFGEDLFGAMSRGEAVREQQELLMHWEELLRRMDSRCVVTVSEFLEALAGVRVSDTINLHAESMSVYASKMKELAEDCQEWLKAGVRVAVLCGGVARGQRLQAALAEHGVPARFGETPESLPEGTVQVLPGTLTKGFAWPEAGLCLISDTDVYGAGYHRVKKRQKAAGDRIAAFTDLKPGDYVVHEDYGVGIFREVQQVKFGGQNGDFVYVRDRLKIE